MTLIGACLAPWEELLTWPSKIPKSLQRNLVDHVMHPHYRTIDVKRTKPHLARSALL